MPDTDTAPLPHDIPPLSDEFDSEAVAAPVIELDPAAGIDEGVLASLVDAGADLSQARRIAHFLYVPNESAAAAASAELGAMAFTPIVWTPTEDEAEWTVVAEMRDTSVTAESIAHDDQMFADLADRHGGRYDGWEATV